MATKKNESKSVIEVTDARAYPVKGIKGSSLLAFASAELGHAFAITGIRVIEGKEGVFVAMPSRNIAKEGAEAEWKDIAFPITAAMREAVSEAVLGAYADATNGKGKKAAPAKKKGKR